MSDIENKLGEIAQGVETLRTKSEQNDAVNAQAIQSIKTEMATELAAIRTDMAVKNAPRFDEQDAKDKALETAAEFMTKGFDPRNELHRKAASESNFAVLENGGFTLPKTFSGEITELLRKNSVIRGVARTIPGGLGYHHLFKTSNGVASKRDELGAVAAGEASTYGEVQFGSAEYYMNVPISVWTMDGDSAVDFAAEARKDIIQGLAELEGAEHLIGETVNILRSGPGASTTVQVKSGLLKLAVQANADRFTNSVGKIGGVASITNKAVEFNDLIALKASLHSRYQANAKYLFGADMETSLFTIKDGNDQYVWAVNQAAQGAPATIRGKEYLVTDHMDGASTAANNAMLAIYADFTKYVIVDQSPISWVVDPITDLRRVKFHARMRQGACLTDFQAARVLTNKPTA